MAKTIPADSPATHLLHPAARPEHWFDRFSMLSDGVFAIAITLLAFDLRGPQTWDGTLGSLWASLAPQLDAFALTFVVISVYWLAHRRFLAMIRAVDAPLTVINLVMLAGVALLPAATKLAEGHRGAPADMAIYGALVIAIGLAMSAMWAYAALIGGLAEPSVPREVRWFLLGLMAVTPPLFLGLIQMIPHPPLGFVPAALSALFLIGWRMRLWVLARLLKRAQRRGA
ncbi:MAG TPA: TMEM175 family protein [Caulobacteraceae bacterium]|jgi:uncharacterized membrane protein|nr:TMEM175 family protein [Caulobacteraceae bacterium]